MNLRLSEDETTALRRKAIEAGRSMQDVARAAIAEYVSDRGPVQFGAPLCVDRTSDSAASSRV